MNQNTTANPVAPTPVADHPLSAELRENEACSAADATALAKVEPVNTGDIGDRYMHHSDASSILSSSASDKRPNYVDDQLNARLEQCTWTDSQYYSGVDDPSPSVVAQVAGQERRRHRRDATLESSYYDDDRHPVIFTYVIVLTCSVLFLWEIGTAHWQMAPFDANPYWGPNATVLLDCGSQLTACIHAPSSQWWRLLSSQFLHAGVIHISLNMMALATIAPRLENAFGWARVAAIYLVSGLCAAFTTALLLPRTICLGASGAIMGLFGAEWADFFANWRAWRHERWERFVQLFLPTALVMVTSMLPFVNFFAHLSGSLCGTLFGLLLVIRGRFNRRGEMIDFSWSRARPITSVGKRQIAMASFGFAAVLALLALQARYLYSTSHTISYCSFCSKFCISTSLWSCASDDSDSDARCGLWFNPDSHIVERLECPDGAIFNATVQVKTTNHNAVGEMCDQLCPPKCR